MDNKPVKNFSKLSKKDKIKWISKNFLIDDQNLHALMKQYHLDDVNLQDLHDDFIENSIGNFVLPLGVAPNFLIDQQTFVIPMVTEESSVVASASKIAKFWHERGGFHTQIINTIKRGQIHFKYRGSKSRLLSFFDEIKPQLLLSVSSLVKNMEDRGGGIQSIVLKDKTDLDEDYFQIDCRFKTKNAMGANFINSCLEQMAKTFVNQAREYTPFLEHDCRLRVIMSILSNYTPECLAYAEVSCSVDDLASGTISSSDYVSKFSDAISIARVCKERAVTHNKGIMNGIDAVVIATGNDFRAVEACAHAYASRDGHYRSLTGLTIENNVFKFWIEIPLALGTVGGMTSLHPLSKFSNRLLGNPDSERLMGIVASVGLAQNFAAVNALITTGIQKGHMKMHLLNILNGLGVTDSEKQETVFFFKDKTVTQYAVKQFVESLRN